MPRLRFDELFQDVVAERTPWFTHLAYQAIAGQLFELAEDVLRLYLHNPWASVTRSFALKDTVVPGEEYPSLGLCLCDEVRVGAGRRIGRIIAEQAEIARQPSQHAVCDEARFPAINVHLKRRPHCISC